jgi:hypothetical protein
MHIQYKTSILATLLLLLGAALHAQTLLSGGVYANTTWTVANSPYRMTGSVVVFPNVTLTIEPGVRIYVDESTSSTSTQHYLEVRGTLNAVGTAAQPIYIKATHDSTTIATWQGIIVKNTQGGSANISHITINNSGVPLTYEVPNTTPRLIESSNFGYNSYGHHTYGPVTLRNCSFNNNYNGIYGSYGNDPIVVENCYFVDNYTGIVGLGEAMDVSGCVFLNNFGYAYWGGAPGSSIRNCTFTGNGVGLTTIMGSTVDSCYFNLNGTAIADGQDVTITNSIFEQNTRGVEVGKGSVTTNNEITGNDVGVIISFSLNASDVQPLIVNNRICSNINYNVENGSDLNYVLDSNCFCLPDSAAIDAMLFDGFDDITRGLVNFSVYDSTCTNILNTVSKVVSAPTAIAKGQQGQFQLFPNPSAGQVELRLTGAASNCDGQVVDGRGQVLQVFRVQGDQHTLDLSALPGGLYLVRLSAPDGQLWTQRIVKR